MANLTLQGNPINSISNLPKVGTKAPNFSLVAEDLKEMSLRDLSGSYLVLNIVPSFDTGTCQKSAIAFNEKLSELDCKLINISMDLPFAQKRFCSEEKIKSASLSGFRNSNFGQDYGVTIIDGPLKGLYSRAVIVINPNGEITYAEQIAEIANEPNYQAAIDSIK